MTGPPSKKEKLPPGPETAGLSRRDLALAKVDEIMAEGRAHRPRPSLKAREELPEETGPINIEEARAEAGPAGRNLNKAAKPERKGLAALHWFFQTLLLLFVLVWVFLLGIFIGRGYLMESAAGRELIARVSEIIGRQSEAPEISIEENPQTAPESTARTPAPAPAPDPAPASSQPPPEEAEPESAVLKTVVTAAQSIDPETSQAGVEEGDRAALESGRDEPEGDGVFLTPESLAEEAGTLPEAEAAKPELRPLSSGGYAVQTTYALNEQAARALIERLKRQGFPAYFYKNSRDQYLVRVGRFANVEEARSARDKLAALGYKEPYISRLEPGER